MSRSKRPKEAEGTIPTAEMEMVTVTAFANAWKAVHKPVAHGDGPGVYNMDDARSREQLLKDIWTKDLTGSLNSVRESNPELLSVLNAAISNNSRATLAFVENKARLVDGVLLNLCRAQSQKRMPLITAALSILAKSHGIPRQFHDLLTMYFKGASASETWTDQFMADAMEHRPPPTEPILPRVTVATFDNLTMNIDYSSYVRQGEGGHKLDMTNWFTTSLPRQLHPTFDAEKIFKGGIFRRDVSLAAFCRLFYLDHVDIVSNRRSRWKRFLRAAANGRLLERPNVMPKWKPHKTYHEPLFGRLQSSYADVEYEMTEISKANASMVFLFLAGDGLSLMRVNHLLAAYPDKYIHQTPVVIPIQGEHPHALFHFLHAIWRLYRPFIMWCATKLKNEQVIEDPNVSVLNVHRFFFLNVLTRACAEYINEIAQTAGADDLDDPVPFIGKADANVDFAWICHFAYEGGFFILDFLQSVRANDSNTLDILWREFFASAHSGTANKTQYVPMAIMRVFWSNALVPDLKALYEEIRTIPSGTTAGCGVGWDWAVELLNAAIKEHVASRVSEQQIKTFVANWALLECVQARLRDLRERNWNHTNLHALDATPDVTDLLEIFRVTVGRTWRAATSPNSNAKVTQGPKRQKRPWVEVRHVMERGGTDAPHVFIRGHVHALSRQFFEWQE